MLPWLHPSYTSDLFIDTTLTRQPSPTSASTFTMGKSDEQQTKKRAHKATDGESKHKNKPSFDATIFEATNDEGCRQSHWGDHFRQLCEFKVQFGHCLVPIRYSANLKLGQWVARQRSRYSDDREAKSTSMAAEQIRALDGIGFDWGISKSDLASIWSARFQQLHEYKVRFGHKSTLPIPISGSGLRINARTIGCTRMKSQVP